MNYLNEGKLVSISIEIPDDILEELGDLAEQWNYPTVETLISNILVKQGYAYQHIKEKIELLEHIKQNNDLDTQYKLLVDGPNLSEE